MNDCQWQTVVSDAERVKGLLDGTVDPSELEDDPELYSLAERIYGREALDEMGISAPVVPTNNFDDPESSNGNNLEVELPDEPELDVNPDSGTISNGSKIPLLAGLLGLMIVGLNVVVGIGAVVELCENPPEEIPIEFNTMASLQEGVLHVTWTITNMDPAHNYSVEWTISEEGSQQVVDSGSFVWASQDTYIHSENAMIEQSPWCYISTLYENGTDIAVSNDCEAQEVMKVMAQTDSEDVDCEDNTRLLWSKMSEYENLESWAPAGTGELLDGALLMLFTMIAFSGLRRKT